MNIEGAVCENIQEFFLENLSESKGDKGIKTLFLKKTYESLIQLLGLENRDCQLKGTYLYRRWSKYVLSSCGAVRVGKDTEDRVCVGQCLESGHCYGRGSCKKYLHQCWLIFSYLFMTLFFIF